jgi:hypothetical protein
MLNVRHWTIILVNFTRFWEWPGSIELSLSVHFPAPILESQNVFPTLSSFIPAFASRNLWDAVFSQHFPNERTRARARERERERERAREREREGGRERGGERGTPPPTPRPEHPKLYGLPAPVDLGLFINERERERERE